MTAVTYPASPGLGAPSAFSGRIFLAFGTTDMRKGFDGLAVMARQVLKQSPHLGAIFAFRGKRGDLVKLLWYDEQGLCLFSKRMDRGRFVWQVTKEGGVTLSSAQLSMLLDECKATRDRHSRLVDPKVRSLEVRFPPLLACHAVGRTACGRAGPAR